VLPRVAAQPLDALANDLQGLRERVLGLGIPERGDAPREIERDEEGQAERRDE